MTPNVKPKRRRPNSGGKDSPNCWQLHAAKEHFSEVFRRALETPQEIRRHQRDRVIMVRADEFRRLKSRRKATNLAELIRNSPLYGLNLNFKRPTDYGRKVDL